MTFRAKYNRATLFNILMLNLMAPYCLNVLLISQWSVIGALRDRAGTESGQGQARADAGLRHHGGTTTVVVALLHDTHDL